jgi:hypothetical protein
MQSTPVRVGSVSIWRGLFISVGAAGANCPRHNNQFDLAAEGCSLGALEHLWHKNQLATHYVEVFEHVCTNELSGYSPHSTRCASADRKSGGVTRMQRVPVRVGAGAYPWTRVFLDAFTVFTDDYR